MLERSDPVTEQENKIPTATEIEQLRDADRKNWNRPLERRARQASIAAY